jgi:hypothetical protein
VKLDKAIEELHDAEAELARRLRSTGERHAVDADLFHLSHTLADQCVAEVRELAPFAQKYGASAPPGDLKESPGMLQALRRKGSELVGRTEAAGLLLLRDLRELYLSAQHTEIAWLMLVQAARAVRDPDLIEVARRGQEQAQTRAKWLRTRIKESSPQLLAAG